jgi:hypothetical protein
MLPIQSTGPTLPFSLLKSMRADVAEVGIMLLVRVSVV